MIRKIYINDDEIEFLLPDDHDLRVEISVYLRDSRGGKKFKIIGVVLYVVRIFLWILAAVLSLKAFQHAYTYHQLANAFEKLGYETNISHSLYVIMGTIAFLCAIPLLSKLGMDYWEKLHLKAYSKDGFLQNKDGYFYANKQHFKIFYKIPNGEYSSTISWSIIQGVEIIEGKCIVLLLDTYTNFFYISKDIFKDDLEFKQVFDQLSQWQQENRVLA